MARLIPRLFTSPGGAAGVELEIHTTDDHERQLLDYAAGMKAISPVQKSKVQGDTWTVSAWQMLPGQPQQGDEQGG